MLEQAILISLVVCLLAIVILLGALNRNLRTQTRKLVLAISNGHGEAENPKQLGHSGSLVASTLAKADFRQRPIVQQKLDAFRRFYPERIDADRISYRFQHVVDRIVPTIVGSSTARTIVCSISIGTKYRTQVEQCLRSHEAFARHHGLNYALLENGPDYFSRPLAWLKLALLSQLTNHAVDRILYLDADALVTNNGFEPDEYFEKLENSGKCFLLTEDQDGINCGVMFIANSQATKILLDLIWMFDFDTDHGTWEQFALKTLMDEYPEVSAAVLIEPDPKTINSFPIERRLFHPTPAKNIWSAGDFICHFSGIRQPHLKDFIKRYAKPVDGNQRQLSESSPAIATNTFSTKAIRRGTKPTVTYSELGKRGQFGNQLFQISACLGYAQRFSADICLPEWTCALTGRHYDEMFPAIKKFYGAPPAEPIVYEETTFAYTDIPFEQHIDLRGNFQSERYFESAEQGVSALFAEPPDITSRLDAYVRENDLTNFNALHIRTYSHPTRDGSSPMARLPDSYFMSAIQRIDSGCPLVVATDDKTFVKNFLARYNIERDVHMLAFEDPLLDFYMLARAEQLAISNSSFSWWAAYLSKSKHIIAPHRYYWFGEHERTNPFWDPRNLYPEHYDELIV